MHQYEIKEISLLTGEEYGENHDLIDKGSELWWLKTPYHSKSGKDVVMIVSPRVSYPEGMAEFPSFCLGVRPTLKISNLESFGCKKGDKVDIFGLQWTVLSGDTVLCDKIIGKVPFSKMKKDREEATNDFKTSDIRDFLNGWLRLENIREVYSTCYDDEIAEAMELVFDFADFLSEDRYCKMFRNLAKEYIENPDSRQGIDFSLNATVGRDLGEIAEIAMAVARDRVCEQSCDVEK